jgi:hypothetical protein
MGARRCDRLGHSSDTRVSVRQAELTCMAVDGEKAKRAELTLAVRRRARIAGARNQRVTALVTADRLLSTLALARRHFAFFQVVLAKLERRLQ